LYIRIDVQIIVLYNKNYKTVTDKTAVNMEVDMLAVNYTTLRENMKTYMDKVSDDYETMIVTRKNNKNVVILSEESYNNMLENMYVMGEKCNYDRLLESKEQLENGMTAMHELIEVEADE